MNKRHYSTKEEVLTRGREAIGIPLGEIDKTGRLKTGKGAIGTVLEESWFDYKPNSDSKPDFPEAGVELKATPYIRGKKGICAKERLVCNIIDYMEEYNKTFETSSFWEKCNTMLIMSYEHLPGLPKGDFTIDEVTLFSFPEKDLLIIERDWNIIIKKVRDGKAHEISEGDTLYLGACTKGAKGETVRAQPFSGEMAKQRAYSLKQSYMTYLLKTYIFGEEEDENIIQDPEVLREFAFEEYILNAIKPYLGRTQESLAEEFDVSLAAKNANAIIISRILGIKGVVSQTQEFQKANIIPKTIRVNEDGTINEHMSFPVFDFLELVEEEWETSTLKTMFDQTKFLFVVFKFQDDGSLVFKDLIFWNMPERDFEDVRVMWEKTVKVLIEGVQFKTVGKRTFNNLPGATENRVSHVRPHARDSSDTKMLPDGRYMTKQSFWLNNTYIREQLEKHWKK